MLELKYIKLKFRSKNILIISFGGKNTDNTKYQKACRDFCDNGHWQWYASNYLTSGSLRKKSWLVEVASFCG